MVIGIGGCSNSGKSELAEQLNNFYIAQNVKVLCQDDFVKRRDFLTSINEHVDWELPSTIFINDYINAVKEASETYDLVICEGLFAFWFNELNELYDKRIFLELDEKIFKERKRKDLRWGKEPDWYIEHIRQSYLKYGLPKTSETDILYFDVSKEINLKEVINFIDL